MLDLQGEPKTADEEKQAEQSVTANVETAMDDLLYGPHPDGGLRAWLAVAGVRAQASTSVGRMLIEFNSLNRSVRGRRLCHLRSGKRLGG